MGSSASCDDSASVSIGFRSCLYNFNSEASCVKHEKCSSHTTENGKNVFLEDLDSSTSDEEDEAFEDSLVKELCISLRETLQSESLQIYDSPEPLCVKNTLLNQENICNIVDAEPVSFDKDVLEGGNKHATILSSELVQSYMVDSVIGDEISCMTVRNEKSEAESLEFEQPLPTTKRLIPALKGSRAQHGIHLDTKLSVKWAPEVYDPPITSSSHTVKGSQRRHHHQHHRSKARKDDHNHKYSKGRSSRASVPERKHAHRRSSASSLSTYRLQDCNIPQAQPLLNSCGQSKIEPADIAATSHQAIQYGSSCYMESLVLVQPPLAKVS